MTAISRASRCARAPRARAFVRFDFEAKGARAALLRGRGRDAGVRLAATSIYLFSSSCLAGLLVLNVTWKGKTYMGTLLDCNRQAEAHKWGPPRYVCNTGNEPRSESHTLAKGLADRGIATADLCLKSRHQCTIYPDI